MSTTWATESANTRQPRAGHGRELPVSFVTDKKMQLLRGSNRLALICISGYSGFVDA